MDVKIAGSTVATSSNEEERETGSLPCAQLACSVDGTDNNSKDLDLERGRICYFAISLCRAALDGNWPAAVILINEKESLATDPITKTYQTLLHIAAGAGKTQFVERLLELPAMDDAALEQKDKNGKTAFCCAVEAGAKRIAEMLLQKNHNLLNLHGSAHGVTPLYHAALFRRSEMANFLYDIMEHELTTKGKVDIFFISIDAGLYDLALKMLAQNAKLAVARRPGAFDHNANDSSTTQNLKLSDLALKLLVQNAKHAVANETALHLLARRSCAFDNANGSLRTENFKLPGLGHLFLGKKSGHSKAFELCYLLWEKMKVQEDVKAIIREPTHLLFDAARNGNFQIVEQLTRSYPDLAWETNKDSHTIFHVAVLHRHANMFRLIHEIVPMEDVNAISSLEDEKANNMLHLVARLPDQNDEPNLTFGTALELQRELLWFKEVKEVMHASLWEKPNKDGQTPLKLFMAEHKSLIEKEKKWIILPILVAMVILAEALELIGELHNKNANAFCISGTASVIALTSSSIALWIFLTRVVHLRAQRGSEIFETYKVIIGLSALLISTISLLVAFFTSFAFGSGNIVDGLASISRLLFRGSSNLFLRLLEGDLLY